MSVERHLESSDDSAVYRSASLLSPSDTGRLLVQSRIGLWEVHNISGVLALTCDAVMLEILQLPVTMASVEVARFLDEACHPDDREMVLEMLTSLREYAGRQRTIEVRLLAFTTRQWSCMSLTATSVKRDADREPRVIGMLQQQSDGQSNRNTANAGDSEEIAVPPVLRCSEDAANAEAVRIHKAEQETANRVQQILDSLPLGCTVLNQRMEFIFCNATAVAMFKTNSKQEYLRRFWSLSPPYQPDGRLSTEAARELVERTWNEGYTNCEWLHLTLDGEPLPVDLTLVRVAGPDGWNLFGYMRDLRDIKAREQERRQSDERMRLMMESMPLACALWNENLEIIACSQHAVDLHRLSSKDEYQSSFFALSPEFQPEGRLSRDVAMDKFARVRQTGYLRFHWLHQTIDGEPIPSEVTLVLVKYNNAPTIISYVQDLRATGVAAP